jgi:spore germination cell wall hydrolase CwlJ-like protein
MSDNVIGLERMNIMKENKSLILTSTVLFFAVFMVCLSIKMQNLEDNQTTRFIDEGTREITVEEAIDETTKLIDTTDVVTKTEKVTKTKATTKKASIKDTTTKKTSEFNRNSAFYLSDYERRVVECMVMGESGAEPYEGQVLVAFCILNACKKDGLQPSQVRKEYEYYGWNANPSQSVKKAVSAVFDDGYKPTNEFILYFYAPNHSKGKWHETQKFVREVGGHRFFAEW